MQQKKKQPGKPKRKITETIKRKKEGRRTRNEGRREGKTIKRREIQKEGEKMNEKQAKKEKGR